MAMPAVARRREFLYSIACRYCGSGDFAFAAAQHAGLLVFDVRDPALPTQVGVYEPLGGASVRSVAYASGYVYAVVSGSGLHALDISTPDQPRLLDVLEIAPCIVFGCTMDLPTRPQAPMFISST